MSDAIDLLRTTKYFRVSIISDIVARRIDEGISPGNGAPLYQVPYTIFELLPQKQWLHASVAATTSGANMVGGVDLTVRLRC